MTDRFSDCLAFTLKFEGGDSNDPRDPGGATRNGITQATYDAWRREKGRTPQSVFKMSGLDRDAIYLAQYWNAMACSTVAPGVDLAVFDAGVNSGTRRALAWKSAAPRADRITTIKAICARRLSFLEGLRTFPVFGKGWRARVTACEALAITMAAGALAPKILAAEARKAKSKSVTAKTSAKAAPIAGASAETIHQTAGGGHAWLTIILIGAVAIAVVALIFRSRIQAERADALGTAAKASGVTTNA